MEETQEERKQPLQQLEGLRHHVQAAEQEVAQLRIQLLADLEHLKEEVQQELGQVLANVCLLTHHEPAGIIFPPSLTHFS